jgi:hypothetical protein
MPLVSRRQFARVLAGLTAASALAKPSGIVLDAFAGPRLPHRLIVHDIDPRAAVFELRVYGPHPRAMQSVLERHGIRPALREPRAIGTAYLIPFESLEARQLAWDQVNADPDWHALQAHGQISVKEISLYRVRSLDARGSEPRP